jgi:hypothetical protein
MRRRIKMMVIIPYPCIHCLNCDIDCRICVVGHDFIVDCDEELAFNCEDFIDGVPDRDIEDE